MPGFIVATVRIHDPQAFQAYAEGIRGLAETFGGEYLVRGAVTEVLEGDADAGERVVVLRFPDADAARAYIGSAAYRAAAEKRAGKAQVTMRLVTA